MKGHGREGHSHFQAPEGSLWVSMEDAWGQGGRRSRGVADEGGAVAQLGRWPRAGREGKARDGESLRGWNWQDSGAP